MNNIDFIAKNTDKVGNGIFLSTMSNQKIMLNLEKKSLHFFHFFHRKRSLNCVMEWSKMGSE